MNHDFHTPDDWPTKAIIEAATLMDALLEIHTGLSPYDRKLLSYYTLATHSVPHADLFPMAKLHGPPGTGKSTAARIANLFAFRPVCFSARGCTLPVFRDTLALAHDGTAIIEEGDAAWKGETWGEGLLSDRYQRSTAKGGLKVQDGEGGHATQQLRIFGATIIHRRIPFADTALESRCIKVHFRPAHGKSFAAMNGDWEAEWSQAEEVAAVADLSIVLPAVEHDRAIAGRVWNTHGPVITLARMLGDSEFEKELISKMKGESMTLKEAQATAELDGIAVRALIEITFKTDTLKTGDGIALKDIRDAVFKNCGVTVKPEQLGAIFDDLGVHKKKSHGVTKIYPTAATLVKACSELSIEDEWIEELRKGLESGAGWNG
jgi:hypothetical protein